MIAQEIQDIAPYTVEEKALGSLVREIPDCGEEIINEVENFLTYDGSSLTYMLINAVKEQQQMIEELRRQVKQLQEK